MINKVICFILFSLFSFQFSNAKTIRVQNINEFDQTVKTLSAGDSVVLANGIWKDVQFKLKGTGAKDQYIYMVAETPGKVFIEGKSRLQFSGEYLYISGLVFRNGSTPKTAVVEFRTSSTDYAYNSVLSNCVIDNFNQHKDTSDHWVSIYGKENRVEYCYFGGKANEGVTLVVWPNDSNSINNNHLITRNYFGPRPRLGSNGGETIRIGTSHVCHLYSGTIIEGNYFERCNGEVEIVSNKSGGNKFLNNTFFECEGSLVLRHGDNAVVAGNWFIGNGKPFTGGVRIINEGHQVFNNFFYKLNGDDFRAPLVVMNGIPNSPANGYMGVKNVVIAHNTYVDCVLPWSFGVGAGSRDRTVTPQNTMIMNNLVYSPNEQELIRAYDNIDGIKFDNNLMVSKAGMLSGEGMVTGELLKGEVWGIDFIASTAKARRLGFVRTDILGSQRTEQVVGAFLPNSTPQFEMASAQNSGPEWYKPRQKAVEAKPAKVHTIKPGTDILRKALSKVADGNVVELEPGVHVVTSKVVLSKSITFRPADKKAEKPVITMEVQRENASIFEIEGSPTVKFENIAIRGDMKARYPVKYAIVTSKEFATGYNLMIDNCEISDFNVNSGSVFNAYKGTIADTIRITNSDIRSCFRGLILSQEKDNVGKYSAECVYLENTSFSNITQYVVDYYRGGVDESTLGGHLYVNHCVFDLSAKEEKQYILRNNGIVNVTIKNSIFGRSQAKTPLRLTGPKHQILHCNFFECSDPKIEKGAISKGLMYENPRFEKKSYVLSKKSRLKGKAEDGGDIGLK